MKAVLILDRLALKLIPVGIVLLTFSLLAGHSIDPDTWWHLADGRWMVENQRILLADPFSYTRLGAAWAHPGYPYEVVLFLLVRQFGGLGADFLACIILAATFLIIWKTLPARPLRKLFLIGAAMLVSSTYWSARPNLFTLLFSVITVVLLERFRAGSRRSVWFLPLVVLAWANLHGSFILAFIFLGIYALDVLTDRARLLTLMMVGIFMVLATLATPYGMGVYSEMIDASGRTAENSLIMEWQSPDFHKSYGLISLVAALLTMVLMGLRTKTLGLTRLLFPIVLIALAFYSSRNIAVFGVLLPFVWNSLLPVQISGEVQSNRPQPWLTGLSLGLILFSLFSTVTSIAANLPRYRPQLSIPMPVGSAEYLRSMRPPGPLFNNYISGGYLIWALAPEYPVFIDSRTNIYGDEIILQSLTIENAQPGWKALVNHWQFRIILTTPDSAISDALRDSPGWQQCYSEPGYLLFLKVDNCPAAQSP